MPVTEGPDRRDGALEMVDRARSIACGPTHPAESPQGKAFGDGSPFSWARASTSARTPSAIAGSPSARIASASASIGTGETPSNQPPRDEHGSRERDAGRGMVSGRFRLPASIPSAYPLQASSGSRRNRRRPPREDHGRQVLAGRSQPDHDRSSPGRHVARLRAGRDGIDRSNPAIPAPSRPRPDRRTPSHVERQQRQRHRRSQRPASQRA